MKRIISLTLCVAVTLAALGSLAGCGNGLVAQAQAEDLMGGITANRPVAEGEADARSLEAVRAFATRLLTESLEENANTLISPLSVVYALAMTANGAKNQTLAQMEEALGLTVDELNECLYAYALSLPEADEGKLSLANSIWFKDDDDFTADEAFLKKNADYYGASLYKAPFDDATLRDINEWVSDKTDGMIEELIDEMDPDAVMYLINALVFDARWQTIYSQDKIREGVFTKEDGTAQNAEFMYSTEGTYIEDNAAGFIKYYEGGRYAFMALLPNEGVRLADYVKSLTGDRLKSVIEGASNVEVSAAIPKFESEYSVEMSDILYSMGIQDAFSSYSADFTGLGSSSNKLYISRVLHKTFIVVDESGTRAGAATAVEVVNESAANTVKSIYLDRPFLYMLIDCEACLPIMAGTLMDIG